MPTGRYVRNRALMKEVRKNLALGRMPEARAKATETIRRLSQTLAWRIKVSETTRKAMHEPEIRKRHLRGLKKVLSAGTHFRGGNGQEPTELVKAMAKILEPIGFIREYMILTKEHGTQEKARTNYKVDFGYPEYKVAIELDGVSHHSWKRQELDRKKTCVLEALGWRVIRIQHA